jgi:hypothetical protein
MTQANSTAIQMKSARRGGSALVFGNCAGIGGVGVTVGAATGVSVTAGAGVSVTPGSGVSVSAGTGVSVASGTRVFLGDRTRVFVGAGSGVSVAAGTSVFVAIGTGVSVAVGTGVSVAAGTGVFATPQDGPVIALLSNVTAPVCAKARPFKLALVCRLIDVDARILPINEVFVPSVAELTTRHHTLHGSPPTTLALPDTMKSAADLKIQTPAPLRVSVPDNRKASAQ